MRAQISAAKIMEMTESSLYILFDQFFLSRFLIDDKK